VIDGRPKYGWIKNGGMQRKFLLTKESPCPKLGIVY
jgi:hypothetical protein